MLNACDTGTHADNVGKIKTAYVALATVQCAGHPAKIGTAWCGLRILNGKLDYFDVKFEFDRVCVCIRTCAVGTEFFMFVSTVLTSIITYCRDNIY